MNSNPVATVNILLSTNRENLQNFIRNGEIPQPKDGSYLFSAKNTNFLSLEATFAEVILKIQDPDEKFITNLIPTNIQEVMGDEILKKRSKTDFFLMYGLGADPNRHWAGPLRISLTRFNHYTEAQGTDIVEMTFSPGFLTFKSQLKQQDISTPIKFLTSMGGSFADKEATLKLAPSIESNPLYSRSQSGSQIAVKIGSVNVNTGMWEGEYPRWTISPEVMTKSVRKLYTNYFRQWGIPNSIILISKEFERVLKKFNRPTIAYNANVRTSKSILSMQTFLAQFGLDLIFRARGKSNSYAKKIDLLLDINPAYKFSNSFKAPITKFYDALGALSNKVIKVTHITENNLDILDILQNSNFSQYFTVRGKPLLMVGELNYILKDIYQVPGVRRNLTPLDKEKMSNSGMMRKYYTNKVLRRYTNNYFQNLNKGGIFDLPTFLEGLTSEEPVDSTVLRFEANTPKSNILHYNFDYNGMTTAAIIRNLGISLRKLDPGKLEKHIKKQLNIIVRRAGSYNLSQVAKQITTILTKTKSGRDLTVPNEDNWKPAVDAYLKYFDSVAAVGGFAGTIKTVPYFNLSDQFVIFSECEIFINKNPSLDDYPPSRENREVFYNGTYIITNFKHVITSREAYSEFSVYKIGYPKKGASYSFSESRVEGSEGQQDLEGYTPPPWVDDPYGTPSPPSRPYPPPTWEEDASCGPDDYG